MIEIRSYRRVFALERRIYRVDRMRLNPAGVPVMGIVYFLALLATSLLAGELPMIGALSRALPWYLRDVALPGVSATVLSVVRIDGRPFHQAAYAGWRYRRTPTLTAGAHRPATVGRRWHPCELLLLPDGSDARMRRMRYTGPGAALVAIEHERSGARAARGRAGVARRGAGRTVVVRAKSEAPALDRAAVIVLRRGVRLLTREPRHPADGR